MTEVAFYHLQRSTLEQALPRLLEKTLAAGKRALVLTSSEGRAEVLAAELWTYRSDSWLPHGTARDGSAREQPVWISDRDEAPNGATFLFLVDGADSSRLERFERCLDLFDGTSEAAVAAARERWKARKGANHTVTYWRQTEGGAWSRNG